MSSETLVTFAMPIHNPEGIVEASRLFVLPEDYVGSHEKTISRMVCNPEEYMCYGTKGDTIGLSAIVNYFNEREEVDLLCQWLKYLYEYRVPGKLPPLPIYYNAILTHQYEQDEKGIIVHEIGYNTYQRWLIILI